MYDKGLFDIYANADKVLDDFLFTTRKRVDLGEVNINIQGFYSKTQIKKTTSKIELFEVLQKIGLDSKVGIY